MCVCGEYATRHRRGEDGYRNVNTETVRWIVQNLANGYL